MSSSIDTWGDDLEGLSPITYETALARAWDALEGRSIEDISDGSGGVLVDGVIEIPFLEDRYLVDPEERKVLVDGNGAPSFMAVLVLHYLAGCDGSRPTGTYLTFREIPGGEMYHSAFKGRAIDRLAREFGHDASTLPQAGRSLNGRELEMGDGSLEMKPFPLLPLVVVVWEGDDEIPASANILFDSIAPRILPMEDLSVVGNLVVSRLVKHLHCLHENGGPQVAGRG